MSGGRKKEESLKEGLKEGTLLSGFVETTLGEVAFEDVMQNGPNNGNTFTYIDIGSIDREGKVIVAPKILPSRDAPSRAKQNLNVGDVLVSLTRPNLNAVAMVSNEHDRSTGSTGFQVLRSKWANPKFLYYLVQTDHFVDEMSALVQGALYPAIRPKDISSFKFLLPSSLHQSRIVAKLEELLSDLDAGVAELKAAQAKLGQYRQSLLKAAVDGSLTAEWRETHTPKESGAQLLERILVERRKRWEAKQLAKFQGQGKTPPKGWQNHYPHPVRPDTANLPELPEGWVWATVDALLNGIETGKSFKCDERPPTPKEIGVIKVSAVSWGEYDEQESKTCTDPDRVRPELFVQKGDFLFSRANTIELVGACVIVQSASLNLMLSDKILRFRFVDEAFKSWLLCVLRSEHGRRQIEMLASGNQESMRNIGQERICSLVLPIPPSEELMMIESQWDEQLAAFREQEAGVRALLLQTSAQRKNILKAAFSGQLVPQDPADEPASVFLERIRAERVNTAKLPKVRRTKQQKEVAVVAIKLLDVLAEAGDWVSAQEAFRRCGVGEGALTERIEELYGELRKLDKAGRLIVESVTDAQGRKLYDKLKLLAG